MWINRRKITLLAFRTKWSSFYYLDDCFFFRAQKFIALITVLHYSLPRCIRKVGIRVTQNHRKCFNIVVCKYLSHFPFRCKCPIEAIVKTIKNRAANLFTIDEKHQWALRKFHSWCRCNIWWHFLVNSPNARNEKFLYFYFSLIPECAQKFMNNFFIFLRTVNRLVGPTKFNWLTSGAAINPVSRMRCTWSHYVPSYTFTKSAIQRKIFFPLHAYDALRTQRGSNRNNKSCEILWISFHVLIYL